MSTRSSKLSDMCAGRQHDLLMCLQFDTRRTPAPQVSLKSQEALSHSYHSARHECNVNRARAEGDTEVHFYHGDRHAHALWLHVCMLSLLCSTVHYIMHPHFGQEILQPSDSQSCSTTAVSEVSLASGVCFVLRW